MQAYIDVHGQKRRLLIKPVHIEITRAEGPTRLVTGKPEIATSYHGAYLILLRNSRTAPEGGAYDKHDFRVRFADGYEYSGRFDLQHTRHYGYNGPRLQDHMRSYLEFLATDERAKGLGLNASHAAEMIETARLFLQTHDVGQVPPILADDEPSEIVRDYRKDPVTAGEIGIGPAPQD